MKTMKFILIGFCFFSSSYLFARFSHKMPDYFDLNEQIKDEHYIDLVSYQRSSTWDSVWKKSFNAYRASSGSLNYRRYNYLGDIKIYTNNAQPVKFEYTQKSKETIADFFVEQKAKILFNIYDKFHISLMTEPETYKKFADYGVSFSYETSPQDRIEIYYWLIDFEYNKKETIDSDRYKEKSYTIGTNFNYEISNIQVDLNLEYDSPHIWQRKSRGYQYEYENFRGDLTVLVHLNERKSIKLNSNYYQRTDKKDWKFFNNFSDTNHRYLERTKLELLLSMVFSNDTSVLESGIKGIFLKTKEDKNVTDMVNKNIEIESVDKAIDRNEIGPFVTLNFPITKGIYNQYGVFLHHINKSDTESVLYAKLQTALEFRIQKGLFIFTNLTWRLHRFFETNPPTRNPWGGGNLQIMYTI